MNFSAQILYVCYYALILNYFRGEISSATTPSPWSLLTGVCTCYQINHMINNTIKTTEVCNDEGFSTHHS